MSNPAHPPGGTTTPTTTWVQRREDADAAVDRLRQSWAWLDLLIEPGPETSAGRIHTEDELARRDAELRAERAERVAVAASTPARHRPDDGGLTALAPPPAPLRLAVVDLQTFLAGRVRRVVVRIARDNGAQLGYPPAAGGVPAWLDWLTIGRASSPWIATAAGVLARRAAFDVTVGGTLAWAADQLGHVDELARAGAGVVSDRLAPLADRCPACRSRSLQLNYTGDFRRVWSVSCTNVWCVCAGVGCPCRQLVRYEGRRHAWSYGELTGRHGLWVALAATRRPRVPVRRSAAGHGHASAWQRWSDTTSPSPEPQDVPVMHIVTDPEGVRWADTGTVLAQVRVDRKLLNDWVRRGLVGAPRPAGGLWWYQLDQVIDAERDTIDSGLSSRAEDAPGDST